MGNIRKRHAKPSITHNFDQSGIRGEYRHAGKRLCTNGSLMVRWVLSLLLAQLSLAIAEAEMTPSQRERLARTVELVAAGNVVAFADLQRNDFPLADRVRSVEAILYGDNDQGHALVARFIAESDGAGAFLDAKRVLSALHEAKGASWRAPLLRVAGSIQGDENLRMALEAELSHASSEPAIQLALMEALPRHYGNTKPFIEAVEAWADSKDQDVARAAALALLELTLANLGHEKSEVLKLWHPQIPQMLEVLRAVHGSPPGPSEQLKALELHAKGILLDRGGVELNHRIAAELLAILRCNDARIIPTLVHFSYTGRSWASTEARRAIQEVQFTPEETAVELLAAEVKNEGDTSTNSFIIENLIINDYPLEPVLGLIRRVVAGMVQPENEHLLSRAVDYCRARKVTDKEVIGRLRGLLEEDFARVQRVDMVLRLNVMFTLSKLDMFTEKEAQHVLNTLASYPEGAQLHFAMGWALYAIGTEESRGLLEKHTQGLWKDGFTSAPVNLKLFGSFANLSDCSSTAIQWLELIDLAGIRPDERLLGALEKIASTDGHAIEFSFITRERELARALVAKFKRQRTGKPQLE